MGFFYNVPITDFSLMPNSPSQYHLLTVLTDGSDNLLIPILFLLPASSLLPQYDLVALEVSCLAVNLGLTSTPLLFAESCVSPFLNYLLILVEHISSIFL